MIELDPFQGEKSRLDDAGIGRRYVRYFNNRHRRTGTLWEGRYRSCLVDSDGYQRYIELNPVRASMVTVPGDYRWSSYRTNAFGKASRLVSPHTLYQQLGSTQAERQSAYRQLFKEMSPDHLVEAIRTTTISGLALGNERFQREIELLSGQSVSAGKPARSPRRETN